VTLSVTLSLSLSVALPVNCERLGNPVH